MARLLRHCLYALCIIVTAAPKPAAQCTAGIQPSKYPRFLFGYRAVTGCDSTNETTLEVIPGGTVTHYQWQYKFLPGGTYTNLTGPGSVQSFFYPLVSGYYRLAVTRSATCTAYSDSIQATIFSTPQLQISPASASVCAGTSLNVCVGINAGSAATEQYYKEWYRNGTQVSGSTDTVSCWLATLSGTYKCIVTERTKSSCKDTISMTISASASSPAPSVTSPVSYCENSTASALTATGSNLKWYANPTTTTYSTTAPTPNTAAVSSLTYWVSQTSATCESPRASITVNVTATPAAPAVTTPVSYCRNAAAGALSATGTSLKWYSVAGGGTSSATAPVPVTTTAHADSFWVSQTMNGCESPRARIIVNVAPLPGKPTTSSNSPVCAGDTLFLTALSPLPAAIYQWSHSGTTYSSTQQNPFIANIGAPDSGLYLVTVTANGCTSLADSIRVKVICLDSVWAGDANADKLVNNLDVLEIAMALGSTGNPRNATSIAWAAVRARDWTTNLVINPAFNRKHADCNGDGTVNYSDTLAVSANYGQAHAKGIHRTSAKATGAPDLRCDLSGIIAKPGKPITVPIYFGNSATSAPATAGIAARIMIDGIMPTDTPQVTYGASWLGNAGNTIRFRKAIGKGRVDWTYARNDHSSITGGGILGYLTFTIPSDAAGRLLKLYFDEVTVVDAAGNRQSGFNIVDDSLIIQSDLGMAANAKPEQLQLLISPNPSTGACIAQVILSRPSKYVLEIRDLSGRVIIRKDGIGVEGMQTVSMPVDGLSAGVYLIHLQSGAAAGVFCRWTKL